MDFITTSEFLSASSSKSPILIAAQHKVFVPPFRQSVRNIYWNQHFTTDIDAAIGIEQNLSHGCSENGHITLLKGSEILQAHHYG